MSSLNVIPMVRELKCSKCSSVMVQRMNDKGHYEKIKICPKCEAEGKMALLRTYSLLNQPEVKE